MHLLSNPVSTELDDLFFFGSGQLNEQKSAEPHRGVSLVATDWEVAECRGHDSFIVLMILHAVHIDVDNTQDIQTAVP